MQTLGFSGKVWFQRWKCIGNAWAVIVVAMFAAVAVAFCAGYVPSDYNEAKPCCEKKCPMQAGCQSECAAQCENACEGCPQR